MYKISKGRNVHLSGTLHYWYSDELTSHQVLHIVFYRIELKKSVQQMQNQQGAKCPFKWNSSLFLFRWTYISSVFALLFQWTYISSNFASFFFFDLLFTYEEYRVHHQQRLSMHRKLWHQLLYELDQRQDNIEMDVFDLQLLHFRIDHLLYRLYLCIFHQVYVFVMYVELKVNRYNKQLHNLLNQV
jgi:hypothetical protein